MLTIYLHHIRKGVDPNYDGEIDAPDADDLKRRRKNIQRSLGLGATAAPER
jgi:phosphinothricin acetyltransferase